MRERFALAFLVALGLNSAVLAHPNAKQFMEQTAAFESADIDADVKLALEKGDRRFLCVTGEGVQAPGLSRNEFSTGMRVKDLKKSRFRIIDETFDDIAPDATDALRRFKRAAAAYAWKYNRKLKKLIQGSHLTLAKHFKCTPMDFQIEIAEWTAFAGSQKMTPTSAEREALRKDIEKFMIISEAESKAMMVSLIATGERRGTLNCPNGVKAEWSQRNFIFVRYTPSTGGPEVNLRLAPPEWLELIKW